MKRRKFISLISAAGVIPLTTNCGDPLQISFENEKNVLLIVVDELTIKVMNAYNYPLLWGKKPKTPNIDFLANNGKKYLNHYTACPICTPSRAALFTGKKPHDAGVKFNQDPLIGHKTIAHRMKEKGYKTGYVGKWHLNGEEKPGFNLDNHGFDDDKVMYNRGHWKQMYHDNNEIFCSYQLDESAPHHYTTNFLTNYLIRRIEKANRKWFYALSLPDPHGPHNVLSDYANRYDDLTYPEILDNSELPPWADKHPDIIKPRGLSAYFGMIELIDDNIGKILSSLRASDELDKTIIIFTSDHGDMLGEHGRNNKEVPFDGSCKLPLIVFGSGVGEVNGYSTNDQVFDLIDNISDKNPSYEIPDRKIEIKNYNLKWKAVISNGIKTIYTEGYPTIQYDLNKDPQERNPKILTN